MSQGFAKSVIIKTKDVNIDIHVDSGPPHKQAKIIILSEECKIDQLKFLIRWDFC